MDKSCCLHGAYIFILMGETDNKQINKITDLSMEEELWKNIEQKRDGEC